MICQVEGDRTLPTIPERKAEIGCDLDRKHQGAYDELRYGNANHGDSCHIRFSGSDDSVATITRNNMDILRDNVEYRSRSVPYGHCSRDPRSSR
jgi:hypothetical protein